MIQQDLLLAWGGTFRKYEKNQPIFFEGDKPLFYYQVMEGTVRMAHDPGKQIPVKDGQLVLAPPAAVPPGK